MQVAGEKAVALGIGSLFPSVKRAQCLGSCSYFAWILELLMLTSFQELIETFLFKVNRFLLDYS